MADTEAAVARSNASERLIYAALTGDPELLAAADDAMVLADEAERNADGPDAQVREAVIQADPVTAAALGWLAFPELAERVVKTNRAVLRPAEEALVEENGIGALRLVVRARVLGVSLSAVASHDRDFSVTHALAARGDVHDAERVRRLLRKHGLLDKGETDSL